MLLWLSVAGAAATVAAACARMLTRRRGARTRPDPDWGDWPPDQMAP